MWDTEKRCKKRIKNNAQKVKVAEQEEIINDVFMYCWDSKRTGNIILSRQEAILVFHYIAVMLIINA